MLVSVRALRGGGAYYDVIGLRDDVRDVFPRRATEPAFSTLCRQDGGVERECFIRAHWEGTAVIVGGGEGVAGGSAGVGGDLGHIVVAEKGVGFVSATVSGVAGSILGIGGAVSLDPCGIRVGFVGGEPVGGALRIDVGGRRGVDRCTDRTGRAHMAEKCREIDVVVHSYVR